MYQEFFMSRGVLILPIVAMLTFLITFVAAAIYALRASRKEGYAELASLPLSDDGSSTAQAGRGSP